jgi:hypothetical protein
MEVICSKILTLDTGRRPIYDRLMIQNKVGWHPFPLPRILFGCVQLSSERERKE